MAMVPNASCVPFRRLFTKPVRGCHFAIMQGFTNLRRLSLRNAQFMPVPDGPLRLPALQSLDVTGAIDESNAELTLDFFELTDGEMQL